MFGSKSKKPRERERFYLLPGQGGRSFRRKQQTFILWSILVAVVFGSILAVVMWWWTQRHP